MPPLDKPFPLPPFAGFRPQALDFFRALADNQNRDWFAAHKADYEHFVREPLQALVADLTVQLAKAKIPLKGDPKKALFRINRDVRFSKDKSPYSLHASAALTRDGEKHAPGVLYIHLAPEGSFAATGFFRPEPPTLHALRLGLVADAKGWAQVEHALAKADLPLMRDDTLVRVPKGFESAPPALEDVLKLKSWVVRKDFRAADMASPRFVEALVDLARASAPLLNFGWKALP